MIKLLGLSGIIFLISLLIGNEVFFVTSFTIFIIITLLNIYKLWFSNGKFSELCEYNDKAVSEEFKSKKYTRASVRFIAIPLCAVGGIFAILSLVMMWKMCVY